MADNKAKVAAKSKAAQEAADASTAQLTEPRTEGDAPQKQPPETEARADEQAEAEAARVAEEQAQADEAAEAAKAQEAADAKAKAEAEAAKAAQPEKKTKTYYARLVRGMFIQPHRRSGFVLEPGPTAVAVDLTKEQKAALDADPGIEFVSKGDAAKVADAQTTIDNVEGNNPAAPERNYE